MNIRKIFNKKLKNDGFTLTEVLVSVAILVIVAGPLLYTFIVSQRVTNKSHFLGEATLASRNIIETIRSEGVERFIGIVSSGTVFGGTVDNDFEAQDLHGLDNTNGIYEFMISGMTAGTLGMTNISAETDTLLDAIVRIDAGTYRSDTAGDGDEPIKLINDLPVTQYSPMDAIFLQPRDGMPDPDAVNDPDTLAVSDFINRLEILNISAAPDDITGKYNRTITLDAVIGGEGDNRNISVTVEYKYEYKHPGYSETFEFNIVYDIYWERYEEGKPLTVYLFYRPHYADTGMNPDSIEIRNMQMLDLTVFVVKQKPTGWDDDPSGGSAFLAKEAGYRATIHQREDYSLYATRDFKTKIVTNFRMNFAMPESTVFNVNCKHWIRYGLYWYEEIDIESDLLVSQEPKDRMFEISISIYRHGEAGGQPLIEYSATHLD